MLGGVHYLNYMVSKKPTFEISNIINIIITPV